MFLSQNLIEKIGEFNPQFTEIISKCTTEATAEIFLFIFHIKCDIPLSL